MSVPLRPRVFGGICTPASVSPSPGFTDSNSAPGGNGPGAATAWGGKSNCLWKSIMMEGGGPAIDVSAADGRFDRRRDPVDRIGFLYHRRVVEFGRRRVDVAAGGDHERHVFR